MVEHGLGRRLDAGIVRFASGVASGLRSLWQRPAYALVSIALLGASTAALLTMAAVLDALLVRPPSGRDPEQLVFVRSAVLRGQLSRPSYLDLRRAPLQRALKMRHEINRATRNYLSDNGCLELETPFLVKYTPGGARNFLVPSRLSPGKFYALAESPQLYKQLFMVAGFDRYFQIVKCFRDEDLRIDRQPEFTQIDVELSFVNQDDVFRLMEGLIFAVVKTALGKDLKELYPSGRFPQMPFAESMDRFGNDKPDMRFGIEHTDLTDLIIEHDGGGVSFWAEIAKKYKSREYRRAPNEPQQRRQERERPCANGKPGQLQREHRHAGGKPRRRRQQCRRRLRGKARRGVQGEDRRVAQAAAQVMTMTRDQRLPAESSYAD